MTINSSVVNNKECLYWQAMDLVCHTLPPPTEQDMQRMQKLFTQGLQVNYKGQGLWEHSLLHTAVKYNHKEYVQLFLTQDDVDINTKENDTPLYVAVDREYLEIMKMLLEHGANVNAYSYCTTLLHTAASRANPIAMDMLIKHGAEVNRRSVGFPGHEGVTPLHIAKTAECVHILVKNGAEVNATAHGEQTPLHYVLNNENSENKESYLHVLPKSAEVMQALLESGADVNAIDQDGRTPLHLVAQVWDQVEATNRLSFLLEFGAAVNLMDRNGQTPLHLIARRGHREATSVLLAHGATTYAIDRNGQTPLFVAAYLGRIGVVIKILIRPNNPLDRIWAWDEIKDWGAIRDEAW